MDLATIGSLISSVGFPIAACCYMVYLHNKSEDRHREEVEKLRQSLDNNTKVMQKICMVLKLEEDE